MDIEAEFQKLLREPNSSIAEYDALYFEAIEELESTPKELNDFIRKLQTLCFERLIDYSRYKLVVASVPPKKQSVISAHPPKKLQDETPASPGPSVNIADVIRLCREKIPFISFSVMRLNNGNRSVPVKLKIVYSNSVNEDWAYKIFRPDAIEEIKIFKLSTLDKSFSWLILFLFHSSDRETVSQIKAVLESNQELLILNLSDFEGNEIEENCWKKDRKNLFNGTISEKQSLLIHDSLDAEQECLIKEFFGSKVGFLVCKNLKDGLSGSQVLLVAPNISPGDPRKHVVKICKKSKLKLKAEFENFQNLVAPFWVQDQFLTAEFKESPNYEAILYPFASMDTIQESHSFTDKYNDAKSIEALQIISGNIFNHSLCQSWRNATRLKKMTVAKAFEPMLNIQKTEEALNKLLSSAYSINFTFDKGLLDKILASEIEFLICPNHGDFHSDNIRVQEESRSIFIIDFGMTAMYPAGLDYAALEASIRFKLLDHSIDPKILLPLDANPLDKFANLIVPGEQPNGEADKAVKICSLIREKFLNDYSVKGKNVEELKLQYLCCLLALCLRQIKYRELNRRYILQVLSQILSPIQDHIPVGL